MNMLCIVHSGHGPWARRGYDGQHIQASLSLISIDWLRLQAAQVPGCRDLAIFVVTTTTDRPIRLLYPCACAQGKKFKGDNYLQAPFTEINHQFSAKVIMRICYKWE